MSLQNKVLNYLKAQPDTWAIKIEVANERGCPDILCSHKGFWGIEVKDNKDDFGKKRKPQIEMLARIIETKEHGCVVALDNNIKHLCNQIDEYMDGRCCKVKIPVINFDDFCVLFNGEFTNPIIVYPHYCLDCHLSYVGKTDLSSCPKCHGTNCVNYQRKIAKDEI